MSILKKINDDLKESLKHLGYDVENINLLPSKVKELGDFQINEAMPLAKKCGKKPREIAEEIVEELKKDKKFTNINVAGPGFINVTLTNEFLVTELNKLIDNIELNIDKPEPKKVVIDFGGANVAKALHVGHLRSANLGEGLKRLARLMGYTVWGDAHLGDYGRPLGLVELEIKKMYPDLAYFDESYNGNYQDVDLPITNSDLEKIYPLASTKAKEDEEYLEEARIITAKIQNKEKGYYDLWKKIIEISKEDIKKVYDSLNVEYDLWLGESDSIEYFDELYDLFEKKGLLKDSEGAKIVELKEETDKTEMPPLLFIKSNGSLSYQTTDLATILQRKHEENPDEIWYCVDGRQSLHFDQVFRAARYAEVVDPKVKLEFIGFGTMNGKDGKPFKTRDGGVMPLKSLIELVNEETYKRIAIETTSEKEKKDIAHKVAIACLKYSDSLPFRGTDYVFEIDKFADMEGKTGAYILYSTIRMKSLLKKAENINYDRMYDLFSQTEKEIALTLMNLPTVLNKTLETKSLNEITDYLYKLTSVYNKFYSENKVLIEEDEQKKISWLVLTKLVYDANILLIDTLGISIPEKM